MKNEKHSTAVYIPDAPAPLSQPPAPRGSFGHFRVVLGGLFACGARLRLPLHKENIAAVMRDFEAKGEHQTAMEGFVSRALVHHQASWCFFIFFT